MMRTPTTLASALIVTLLSCASLVRAQGTDGEIQGLVVDVSGGARFVAPAVAVGLYEVTAAIDGFAPRRHEDLRVSVGKTVSLRIELRAALDPETITVAELPPVIEPTRSHPAAVF